jgi:XapX domain-containing protein
MRMYLLSLGAGVMVGVIYSLIDVRSPAPPLVALVGLLGILFGGQIIPVGKQMLAGSALTVAWQQSKCTSYVFGMLPGCHADQADEAKLSTTDSLEKCP